MNMKKKDFITVKPLWDFHMWKTCRGMSASSSAALAVWVVAWKANSSTHAYVLHNRWFWYNWYSKPAGETKTDREKGKTH